MPDAMKNLSSVESRHCEELYAIQDAIDILEETLPKDVAAPIERASIARWRSLTDAISATELSHNQNSRHLLAEIHTIGQEIYALGQRFPKNLSAMDLLDARDVAIKQVGQNLVTYDAKGFMLAQERAAGIEGSPEKTLGITLRYSTFCANKEPHAPAGQEFLALFKHELADITDGAIERPGSRDVFDPALVEIKRNWQSVTQLTTEISYDGETIGDFGDNAILHALGCYQPKMDEMQAIVAARRMFYEGHPFERDINPMVTMTHEQMYEQIVRDLEAAEGMTLSTGQRCRVNDLRKEFDATVTPPTGVKRDTTALAGPGM